MATYTDNFNRADGGIGANYTQTTGASFSVVSNRVKQTATAGVYRFAKYTVSAMDSANYRVDLGIARSDNGAIMIGAACRCASGATNSGYIFGGFGGDAFYLLRIDAGSENILATGSGCASGTEYAAGISADGSTIRGFRNNVQDASVTDTTYATGTPGIGAYGGNATSTQNYADDWQAADLVANTNVSSSDSVTLTDATASLSAAETVTDTATLSDASAPAAALAATDSATIAEQSAVDATQQVSSSDSAALAESVTTAAVATTTDSAALAEARTLTAPITATDSATLAEARTLAASETVTDSATLAEVGAIAAMLTASEAGALVDTNNALRFYGNGTSNIDRARIPLDTGGTSTAADVGSGDFTIEVWLQAAYADNDATSATDARESNIFLDRDIWGHPRGWVAGLERNGATLRVVFGVAGSGGTWTTIRGTTDVGDNQPHHVAIVRNVATGLIQIFVDGEEDASGTYTTGDLSYPDGFDPGLGLNNTYLVLGAEKHDAGSAYPSYNGYLDELRISTTRRYTGSFTPQQRWEVDGDTAALYHMDSASSTTLIDATGRTNGELLVGGSPSGPVWINDGIFAVSTIAESIGANSSDSAALTDATATLSATETVTDSAALDDAASVAPPLAATDTAALAEQSSLAASQQVSSSDVAALAEALDLAAQANTADAATLAEAAAHAAMLAATDAATIAEQSELDATRPVSGTDSAALAEVVSLAAQTATADAATLAEAAAIAAPVAATDSATLDEQSAVDATQPVASADAATLNEVVALAASIATLDSATLAEAVAPAATLAATDSATLAEQSLLDASQQVADTDSATLAAQSAVSALTSNADSATLAESSVLTITLAREDVITLSEQRHLLTDNPTVVDLTLRPRDLNWTLRDRSLGWTVRRRS